MAYRRSDVNPLNSISSILVLVLGFILLYFVAKGIFTILAWIAPVLLILTAIFDYRTIIDYGKWIVNLLGRNPLMGIGAVIMTVIGFPVIAGFLFVKALFRKKVNELEKNIQMEREGQFVDYEEVDSQPIEPLELPSMEIEIEPEPEVKHKNKNDYDDLFE